MANLLVSVSQKEWEYSGIIRFLSVNVSRKQKIIKYRSCLLIFGVFPCITSYSYVCFEYIYTCQSSVWSRMQTKAKFIELTTYCIKYSIFKDKCSQCSPYWNWVALMCWSGLAGSSYAISSTDEQLLELNGNQPEVLDVGSFSFILRLIQERCAYINTAINNILHVY